MELDPQIVDLVAATNAVAAESPPLFEQTVAERREAYSGLAALSGEGPAVDRVQARTIAGVPCRLYAHGETEGIVVFFHGGGWVIGDLDTHDYVCRDLAVGSGATVVSVDYRLAPEAVFPAAVQDAWAVVKAVAEDPGSFGGGAIAVAGDSAGGNIAAVMALMARDSGIGLAAQLLVYPAVDADDDSPSMVENGEGYVLTAESMRWFYHHYAPDPTDWRASPARAESLAGVAPALVITAGFDPLRDQGIGYAKALAAAGIQVDHTNYEHMVHAFYQFGRGVTATGQALDQVANAARTALR